MHMLWQITLLPACLTYTTQNCRWLCSNPRDKWPIFSQFVHMRNSLNTGKATLCSYSGHRWRCWRQRAMMLSSSLICISEHTCSKHALLAHTHMHKSPCRPGLIVVFLPHKGLSAPIDALITLTHRSQSCFSFFTEMIPIETATTSFLLTPSPLSSSLPSSSPSLFLTSYLPCCPFTSLLLSYLISLHFCTSSPNHFWPCAFSVTPLSGPTFIQDVQILPPAGQLLHCRFGTETVKSDNQRLTIYCHCIVKNIFPQSWILLFK